MRRFLITSSKFTGQAELIYNADALLSIINMTETSMDAEQRHRFKQLAPLTVLHIEKGGHGLERCTIVEAAYEITFSMFWDSYKKKINRNRCEPLWNKLAKTSQVKAWHGIAQYDKYLKANDWRKKADPENYLRNEMWENEW